MTLPKPVLLVALAVAVLAACAHAGAPTDCPAAPVSASGPKGGHELGPKERAKVVAVLHGQRDAWNRGDLAGYMAGYERSDVLVFTSGGAIARGFEPTHDRYQRRYGQDRASMGHLEFDILDVRGLGGSGAVVLGRYVLTETPRGGSGVFTVVLSRGPGGWVIVHDHTSADPETPPDEANAAGGVDPRTQAE